MITHDSISGTPDNFPSQIHWRYDPSETRDVNAIATDQGDIGLVESACKFFRGEFDEREAVSDHDARQRGSSGEKKRKMKERKKKKASAHAMEGRGPILSLCLYKDCEVVFCSRGRYPK